LCRSYAEPGTQDSRQEIEEFISIVIHDLKRPLVSMFGLLNVLKDSRTSREEDISDLNLLLSECERMKQTIATLTEFLMIDHAEIKRESVHLKEMLDTIVRRFQREIEAKQVDVRIECPDIARTIPRLQIEACP
jgi:signal transduction histidine kinase